MKNKILLLSVPFSAKGSAGPNMENHGLCYIKASLIYHGFYVHMIDGNALDIPWHEAINQLDFDDYFLTGFSVYSTNYNNSVRLIKAMRKSGFTGHITMGGHYPTFSWHIILNNNHDLDSIITGEGETPVVTLAESLKSGKDWKDIEGLACRKDEEIICNPCGSLINPLKFPFLPDRESYGDLLKKQNFATISSSRGCWGNCTFCSVRTFYKLGHGPCWRPRAAEDIVDEIEYLNKEGIANFAFCDDNFIGVGKEGIMRARSIGEEIIRRKLDIAYAIDCRPDDLDEDLFSFLSQSGLIKVNIGIESFVERQQKLYSKTLSFDMIEQAILLLKKQDFLIGLYTIFFDPFVTFEELSLNFNKALDTGPEYFPEFATFLQVFPGIPLYEEIKRQNLLDTHKVLVTKDNEYWINYRFQYSGIEEFFVMCLQFEATLNSLLSPFTGTSLLSPEKYYELYRNIRILACNCFVEGIEQMNSGYLERWIEKARKLITVTSEQ
jgi:radical SAM superfamily enzyme YgiQ (UPF0313 family)